VQWGAGEFDVSGTSVLFFSFMRYGIVYLWLRQIIEGSEEIVKVQHGGTSIIVSPSFSFSDRRTALWRIKARDKSAVVVVDFVQLFVAKRRKFFFKYSSRIQKRLFLIV